MCGDNGACGDLYHIPKSRIGEVGYVHQHPKGVHLPDKGPSLLRESPVLLLGVGAGESIGMVPGEIHGTDTHLMGNAKLFQVTVQKLRPLGGKKGGRLSRLKRRFRFRTGAAERHTVRVGLQLPLKQRGLLQKYLPQGTPRHVLRRSKRRKKLSVPSKFPGPLQIQMTGAAAHRHPFQITLQYGVAVPVKQINHIKTHPLCR